MKNNISRIGVCLCLSLSTVNLTKASYIIEDESPLSKKIAVIGGLADDFRDRKDGNNYLLLNCESEHINNFNQSVEHDINNHFTQKQKTGILSSFLGQCDRVIFENTHVNTFNPIAIQNGLDLLKDKGILSMNAIPEFNFVSEERKDAFDYSVSLLSSKRVWKMSRLIKAEVFDVNEAHRACFFRLYERTISPNPGAKRLMLEFVADYVTGDSPRDFYSSILGERATVALEDQKAVRRIANSSGGTGDSFSHSSASENSEDSALEVSEHVFSEINSQRSEEDNEALEHSSSRTSGSRPALWSAPHINYNDVDFLYGIKQFLEIPERSKVKFGMLSQSDQTWVHKSAVAPEFAFLIEK